MSAHMADMPHHTCTFVLSSLEAAAVIESGDGLHVLQLPCGGLKVLHQASLEGRVLCTGAGPFSPCPSGSADPAPMLAGILARLRSAAVGEAAGMGIRHSARAEVLAEAASAMDPELQADLLLAEARRPDGKPQPDPARTLPRLSAQQCRHLASSFLFQALQLRPSVIPTPDRVLSALDQRAEARYGLLLDLALTSGAGLTAPSPGIRPRVELMLDEGRSDSAGILQEAWNESLWA